MDLDNSLDSYIAATLTLFLSITTPSSVGLLAIPLAFSHRTLNGLLLLIDSLGGARVGGGEGGGGCWAEQESQVQSIILRY